LDILVYVLATLREGQDMVNVGSGRQHAARAPSALDHPTEAHCLAETVRSVVTGR
jgi:ATP-dependent protease HslVU (ClpYQ) peptidase subunit